MGGRSVRVAVGARGDLMAALSFEVGLRGYMSEGYMSEGYMSEGRGSEGWG